MRIRWYLFDLTPIAVEYLKADVAYFKYHTLFRATKLLKKMDESIGINWLGKLSGQADMIFQMVRSQNTFTSEQIDEVLDFKVDHSDYHGNQCVVLELFISDVFIETQGAIKNPMADVSKKVRKIKKLFSFRDEKGYVQEAFTHQGYIDAFEGEIRKTYTRKFSGEILEDDGKELIIHKLKL